jgi:hypothetical protein
MRFLQADKFSYFIQRIWLQVDLRKLNGESELNSHLYGKFLKASFTEACLTIILLLVLFLLTFKSLDFNFARRENFVAIDQHSLKELSLIKNLTHQFYFFELLGENSKISNLLVIKFLLDSKYLDKLNRSLLDISFKRPVKNCSNEPFEILKGEIDQDFINKIDCMRECCLSDINSVKLQSFFLKTNKSEFVYGEIEASERRLNFNFVEFGFQKRFLNDINCIILFSMLGFYTIFFIFEELIELFVYKLKYLRYLLNMNDLCLTTCIIIIMFMIYQDFILINYNLMNQNISSINSEIMTNQGQKLSNMLAIALFLTWIKCFKFINVSSGLTLMNATLTSSFEYLICYMFVFASTFVTFGELMHRLNGQKIYECSTFSLSQFTILKFLLAEVDMRHMYENQSYEIVFLLFFFFVFIILSGIFLAIINESYVKVSKSYEKKPELDYYNQLIKPLWKKLNIFRKKNANRNILPKTTINLIQDIKVNRLDQAMEASKLRKVLLAMNHNSLDIDAIFNQYNINENVSEDDSDEILLEPDLCQDIVKRLDLSRNRIAELSKKKLSFLKPVWYEMNVGKSKSETSLKNRSDVSSFLTSSSLDLGTSKFNSCTTLNTMRTLDNDEAIVNAHCFDNKFSELITRRDYLRVKSDLDRIEMQMYELSDALLKVCVEAKSQTDKSF